MTSPDDTVVTLETRLAAEALIIDVDGFEGPLDLLLTLSRSQKVDLRQISVLALAEQYLAFINRAGDLRIELAADYLVMAAWLAYLKSRLLLPPDPADEGPSGEDLALHLAFQLQRLEAMRDVAARLMARDQKGRDFFVRGLPEDVTRHRRIRYTATLHDLMQGYARIRTRDEFRPYVMDRNDILSMEQALDGMRRLIGFAGDWTDLSVYLPDRLDRPAGAPPLGHRGDLCGLARAGQGRPRRPPPGRELRPDRAARPPRAPPVSETRGAGDEGDLAPGLFEAPPLAEQERMVEAILFASAEPVTTAEMNARMPHGADADRAVSLLRRRYEGRGVQVVRVGEAWAIRTAPDLGFLMQKETVETRKLSRAAIETLAIVAYHQPVTRAEIEEIRGVTVSRGTLDQLLELDWIRFGRRRNTPGRPSTFIVTQDFLDHFGLESARDLPGLRELRAAGLLDARPAPLPEGEDDGSGSQTDMFGDEAEETGGEDSSGP